MEARISHLRELHDLERIYRFDLGQNNLGRSPLVVQRLQALVAESGCESVLNDYPVFDTEELERRLGVLHGVPAHRVVLGAGIEQLIGTIAYAFLGPGTRFVVNDPSFFVFDQFSSRTGATGLRLPLLRAEDFDWTERTLEQLRGILARARPRVLWIATPNNPTGRALPASLREPIVRAASAHDTLVVFDEAYGEFCDPDGSPDSASSLLRRHRNVIVLRTFSKAYGLAGLRVGYALAGDGRVRQALLDHSYNFPVSQLSLEAVGAALDDREFLARTRGETRHNRVVFQQQVRHIAGLQAIDSDCCILMVGHDTRPAAALQAGLERHGCITARIPGPTGARFLRVTLGTPEDNAVLADALARVV